MSLIDKICKILFEFSLKAKRATLSSKSRPEILGFYKSYSCEKIALFVFSLNFFTPDKRERVAKM